MPRGDDAERDDSGQYQTEYATETFVDELREHDGAASTREVADAVGCEYRTAYDRLQRLEDSGRVETRDVGGFYLWQLAKD